MSQFKLSKNVRARAAQIEALVQCAEYVTAHDSDWDEFEEYVSEGNDPKGHVYYCACFALYGKSHCEKMVKGILDDQAKQG